MTASAAKLTEPSEFSRIVAENALDAARRSPRSTPEMIAVLERNLAALTGRAPRIASASRPAPAAASASIRGVPCELIAYSGGLWPPMPGNMGLPGVLDLSTLRGSRAVPLMLRHAEPAGSVEWRVEGGQLRASGVVQSNTLSGELIVNAARLGRRWKCSLFANDLAAFRVPDGRRTTLNGRSFTGPFVVYCGATLREITITEDPADPNTSAVLYL
ncbi:MAG: hypothetical protein U0791_24290 [Gemmataceae bacterium]